MNYTSKLTPTDFAILAAGLERLPRDPKAAFSATVMRSKVRAHTIHIVKPYGAKKPEFYTFLDPSGTSLTEADKAIIGALWKDLEAASGAMYLGSFRVSVQEKGKVTISTHCSSVPDALEII